MQDNRKTKQMTEEEIRQKLVKFTAKAFREARKNQMHGGGNWIDRAAVDVVDALYEFTAELEAEYDRREAAIEAEKKKESEVQNGKATEPEKAS